MSTHSVRAHQLLLVALALAACGDDMTGSNASGESVDAGERMAAAPDAAAEGGKKAPRNSTGTDKPDAGKTPTRAAEKDAGQPTKPAVPETDQPVTLRFRAQVGDAAFACGRVYVDQGSTRQSVVPIDLRLFIQDVALVDDEGREVPVQLDTRDPWQNAEVALLDFEDASGECFGDTQTNHEITGVVPKGKYSALRFSNGVPEKLNHADPKSFPPPLQTPGMSWNWLLGLRFLRFEMGTQPSAELDLDAGAAPGSYSLHVGSTGCAGNQNAGTIRCNKPNRSRVELKNFDLDKSEIVLDVGQFLNGSDLSKVVECHSGTTSCEPAFKALGVNYATGEPATEQSAFRLK